MDFDYDKQITDPNPKNTENFLKLATTNCQFKTHRCILKKNDWNEMFTELMLALKLNETLPQIDHFDGVKADIPYVLSKHGRIKITRTCNLIDEFEIALSAGEMFSVTLFIKAPVPTNREVLRKYVTGEPLTQEEEKWKFDASQIKLVYIPIKKLINPPARFRFFETPIALDWLQAGILTLQFEITSPYNNQISLDRKLLIQSYLLKKKENVCWIDNPDWMNKVGQVGNAKVERNAVEVRSFVLTHFGW